MKQPLGNDAEAEEGDEADDEIPANGDRPRNREDDGANHGTRAIDAITAESGSDPDDGQCLQSFEYRDQRTTG